MTSALQESTGFTHAYVMKTEESVNPISEARATGCLLDLFNFFSQVLELGLWLPGVRAIHLP
jgi:hypothetical protein